MNFDSSPSSGGKFTNAVDCPHCGRRFWISDIAKRQVGSVQCPHCSKTTSKK